jgi:hypothetical protein
MKSAITFLISLTLACAITAAGAAETPRIDAMSDGAFDKSFAKLVRSLHGYERRQFALGLFGVLIPRSCLSPEATIHLTFAPVAPSDGPLVRSCREHLQGKSYEDILKEGEPKPTDSQAAWPNHSFKPKPLRGSA